ncbi:MAG: hypothetical protein ACLUNX_05130 [Angelakisella sp.]
MAAAACAPPPPNWLPKRPKGYGPAAGYPSCGAIAAQYADLPCPIPPEEVTVTAGSKEALGALFSL